MPGKDAHQRSRQQKLESPLRYLIFGGFRGLAVVPPVPAAVDARSLNLVSRNWLLGIYEDSIYVQKYQRFRQAWNIELHNHLLLVIYNLKTFTILLLDFQ